jgi:broad specificity phosphatase PhoE
MASSRIEPASETPRAVWIIRHADRLDFEDPTWFRTAPHPHDPPLSPSGHARARALAERLRQERIAHIVSSPFIRAVETAHAIADLLELPIGIDRGLSEWLNSAWFPSRPDTLSASELARRYVRVDPSRASLGDARWGESGDEAAARAAETARRLVAALSGNLVLVGHGVSVLAATRALLGGDPGSACPSDMPYCFAVKLVQVGAAWSLDDAP